MTRPLLLLLTLLLTAGRQSPAQASGSLAVVNQTEHNVVLLSPKTGKIERSVSVGVNGHEVATSADGTTLYVPIYGDSGVGLPGTDGRTIDVIDTRSFTVAKTIDLGRPLRPHKAVLGPDGLLYVTGELGNAVEVIDPKAGRVIAEIPTGASESHMLVLSPDGRRAYTANVGGGSVSVLDLVLRKPVTVIPLTKRVQRIAISNDGGLVFTSDQDQPRVAVLDTRTNTLERWIRTSAIPRCTQPTPDGRYLLVSESDDEGKGALGVVNLLNWQTERSFDTRGRVSGFFLHGSTVYTIDAASGRLQALDVSAGDPREWKLAAPIQLSPGSDGMAWVAGR